jgi:hypothetical protein
MLGRPIYRRHLVQLLKKLTAPALRKWIEAMNAEWFRALLWRVNFFGTSFSGRFELALRWLAEKFGVKASNGVIIDLKLSQGDFAQIIGCSRPVVHKLFSQMLSVAAIELTQTGKILVREHFHSPEHDTTDR